MKKKLIFAAIGFGLVVSIVMVIVRQRSQTTKFSIGILQTAAHPALDQAREGFETKLKQLLGNEVSFVYNNFDGNIPNGFLMAQSLVNNAKLDAIFAIATPAAQLVTKLETTRPVLIAAVTNPAILSDGQEQLGNVWGSCDTVDIDAQCVAIKTLLPTVRRITILYTQSEPNACFLKEKMEAQFSREGFNVQTSAIINEAELATQLQVSCRNTDLIIAPTDNLVATSAHLVANICIQNKIPFIVSDPLLVAQGPLFAAGGVDYRKSGEAVAVIAATMLRKQIPASRFEPANQTKIIVNQKTAKELGLDISGLGIELIG